MTVSLRLAVCLYPGVTALDYQGPIELFGFISNKSLNDGKGGLLPLPQPYTIETTFLSHNMEPVEPSAGPMVLPNASYTDSIQYDIILVPGAPTLAIHNAPEAIIQFLKKQKSGAQFILSVCTGSWFLAKAGILNGRQATTNKEAFRSIVKETEDLPITWVKKARWVVDDDNKLWTSSGVTAGQDMANAFLDYLIGKPNAEVIRNTVELSVKSQGDDEFAEYYRLVDGCGN